MKYVLLLALVGFSAHAQQWKDAPAYAAENASNVLSRSTYFIPTFGAVYPEKFQVLLKRIPFIRGVVIHNHGCSGQIGWETHVSQFYYRNGFAVVAPEFVTRQDNKLGCAGNTPDEALASGIARFKEGIYTARNPARLSARGDDVAVVVSWLKTQTDLPIILSGHSEGCRTVYHWNRTDPRVIAGVCFKQSVNSSYDHLWRWDVTKPMWSSIEDGDVWAGGSKTNPSVGFKEKFKSNPSNLTEYRTNGDSHDPLNSDGERASLREWLLQLVPNNPPQTRFNYETALPDIQKALRK